MLLSSSRKRHFPELQIHISFSDFARTSKDTFSQHAWLLCSWLKFVYNPTKNVWNRTFFAQSSSLNALSNRFWGDCLVGQSSDLPAWSLASNKGNEHRKEPRKNGSLGHCWEKQRLLSHRFVRVQCMRDCCFPKLCVSLRMPLEFLHSVLWTLNRNIRLSGVSKLRQHLTTWDHR